ncbi:MAG: nucleotidyltransferase domain-containing protein [Planctomycetota bacterium]
MRELSEDLLAEIVERLVATLQPEQVYLFGSHAYGEPNRYSDLDFLVVVPDEAGEADELALAGRRALLSYPFPVDILIYPRSEMDKWAPVRCSLPHTVVRKGRELYAARLPEEVVP